MHVIDFGCIIKTILLRNVIYKITFFSLNYILVMYKNKKSQNMNTFIETVLVGCILTYFFYIIIVAFL